MKRLFVLLLLLFAVIILKGQTLHYGMIDTTDLKLTSCDFEKSANSIALFDKIDVTYDPLIQWRGIKESKKLTFKIMMKSRIK